MGAVVPVMTVWQLARAWYDDRFDLDWRRKTPIDRQSILRDLGLTGEFWEIR